MVLQGQPGARHEALSWVGAAGNTWGRAEPAAQKTGEGGGGEGGEGRWCSLPFPCLLSLAHTALPQAVHRDQDLGIN